MTTRLTNQGQAALTLHRYLNRSDVDEDPTYHNAHDAPTPTKVQGQHVCPTGHASTYRSAYATYGHGIPQSYAKNCGSYTYDGGTQKNPKCVSCFTQRG